MPRAACSLTMLILGAALTWAVLFFGGCSTSEKKVECPQTTTTTQTTTTRPRPIPDVEPVPVPTPREPQSEVPQLKFRIQPGEDTICFDFKPHQWILDQCLSQEWVAKCSL